MGRGARTADVRKVALEADVVMFVGTRTNAGATDFFRLFPKSARYIHLDMDGYEVGRNYESLRLVVDAKATLAALLTELSPKSFPNRDANHDRAAKAIAAARTSSDAIIHGIGTGHQGAVRPEYMMQVLDGMIRPQDIVAADASYATAWVATFMH